MLSTSSNLSLIRNYILTAATFTILSVGLADLYYQPSRMAQQSKLDQYGRYMAAGLVTQTKSALAR